MTAVAPRVFVVDDDSSVRTGLGRLLEAAGSSALGIAEKTVKVYRARVMKKMRAGSLVELVRLADRVGIILGGPSQATVRAST